MKAPEMFYKFRMVVLLIVAAFGLCVPAWAVAPGKFTYLSATTLEVTGTGLVIDASKAGQISSFTTLHAGAISASSLSVGAGGALSVNISTTAGGFVRATSATFGTVSATDAIEIGGNVMTSMSVPIGSVIISTTTSTCTVTQSSGVAGSTCVRLSVGAYAVSGTFANTTYKPICNFQYSPVATGPMILNGVGGPAYQNRTDGFFTGSGIIGPGSAALIDNVRIHCVIFP